MKILLITQYFFPENFKSNDIAFELTKRGYKVTVLTGIPNYPQGKFYKGYGVFRNRKQYINGVKIIRSLLLPRGRGGGVRLGLNYFSWAFFASIRAFFLAIFNKYDAIIVHEPSPVIQCFPAIIVKKIRKIPIYFWVLDLWPESLMSAGGVKNKRIISFFTGIVKYIYKCSDKILISSRGFKDSILQKGDFENKLIYFPNWAENIFEKNNSFKIPRLPDGFKLMFAGNIGEAQDFEHLMQAALYLKTELDVKFIIIGGGRKKNWVEDFINKNELHKTVILPGHYPLEAMPAFFQQADMMLLSLKDELIFNLTVPAKLQAYMASGKPVLAMLNGEGAEIIKEAGCGFSVDAGDALGLVNMIKEVKKMDFSILKKMGRKGSEYCNEYFNIQKCMDHLCEILNSKY